VVRTWPATGTGGIWAVGYGGNNIWVSDLASNKNVEFTREGVPTGRSHDTPWATEFAADMAFDTTHDCMAQVNFGGDNGIYCWSTEDGSVQYSIAGDFPWTAEPQLGLAYSPDDDSFFIGGWNSDTLFRVKGTSHPDKGAVVSRCEPATGDLAGLEWNPWFEVLWAVARGEQDEIQRLDPETCAVLDVLPSPTFEFGATGLGLDRDGDLLLADSFGGDPGLIHQIETGIPAFSDLPWLAATPTSGSLRIGASRQITVTLDTTGLAPGIHRANLVVLSNSGRRPQHLAPVILTVRK
jgi:hypothetical protein